MITNLQSKAEFLKFETIFLIEEGTFSGKIPRICQKYQTIFFCIIFINIAGINVSKQQEWIIRVISNKNNS